ncbi:DUF1217 domain-containing protein [Salinarimonas soli]|uniref:DUF1217 domain-containing protein n=1 Tax=Salinarimonas soli TaxID=1638099 RepID=A0A5B2VGR9_9HYPH|nr:DUF1217 domain-containing protein [Salinarimonas soli]KAA2237367.1 DUF1217 domain-containing protein [Salinarimonas soli]
MLSTALAYNLVTRDLDKSLARTASDPAIKREITAYEKSIRSVKSIDDFLENDTVYRVAMKAFGLEDMIYAKGFMRKVLEGGIASRDSFANKLADKRYREFADTFNFAQFGSATTAFSAAQDGVVKRYVRQTLEQREGESNEGVRLALYFARMAPGLKNAYQVLADPALSKVVRTALNLPEAMATTDIDKQARLIESRITFADFKDKTKLDAFLKRFASMNDVNQPQPMATALASLMAPVGSAGSVGIRPDLLVGLQSIRFGR